MGKITWQKARKKWRCSKCGKMINVGDLYCAMRYNYNPVKRRCAICKFEAWEHTSSRYLLQIGRIKEQVSRIEIPNLDYVESILSELECIAEDLENNLDKIPDNLRESKLGNILESRRDSVRDIIEEIERLDETEMCNLKTIVCKLN